MLYDIESHAKDGRCGLSRNEDIRRYVGKLVEKQTLVASFSRWLLHPSGGHDISVKYNEKLYRTLMVFRKPQIFFLILFPSTSFLAHTNITIFTWQLPYLATRQTH